MSEVNESAAVVEAPAEAAPEVSAPVPETAAPKNAAEARQAIRDRVEGRSIAAEINNVPQPRDEQGRFASTQEPEPETEAPTQEAVATEANAPAAATEAPAPERIQLPENHPLRARGKQYVDELDANEIRSLVNAPIRAHAVDEAEAKARQAEHLRLQAEAEATAMREQLLSFMQQPEIAAKYAELKAWDEAEANRWLKGVLSEMQESVGAKVSQIQQQQAQQEMVETVNSFLSSTQQRVFSLAPAIAQHPRFQQTFEMARRQYGTLIDMQEEAGQPVTLSPDVFINDFLYPLVKQWPEVQAAERIEIDAQRAAMTEQIRKEALAEAEAERRRTLEAQVANRSPLARIPSNAAAGSRIPPQQARTAAEQREKLRQAQWG